MRSQGVQAKIIEVTDNNDIDREVHQFKPGRVVIEALWVVPEKFQVLKKLHPEVSWWIHLHSHMPFLSLEGVAMGWLSDYAKLGVNVIANSLDAYCSLKTVIPHNHLVFLPNIYLSKPLSPVKRDTDSTFIHIACYGALRPLKNHMIQALAALQFARSQGKWLCFHINGSRVEGGASVLKNLRQFFERQHDAALILDDWINPEEFVQKLHSQIDIGMQVSLSETFNVVSADYVTAGLPIVVSDEVKWASWWSKVEPHDINSIVHGLHRAYNNRLLVRWNQRLLKQSSEEATTLWNDWARD